MRRNHLLCLAVIAVFAALFVAPSGQAAVDTLKAKEMLNAGIKATQEGKSEEAILAYQSAIQFDPNFADAYMNLGAIYFEQKQYEEALEQFRKAAEKNPKSADAFANMGRVDYTLRRYPEAIDAFQKAIANNGQDGSLYRDLGKAYYQNKDEANAVTALEKCHSLNAGDYLTYLMVGRSYDKLGQDAKAVEALNKSIQLEDNYSAHFALGQIYMGQEKYTQAGAAFKKALAADGKKYLAAYNYASAMEFADPENYDRNITNWESFIRLAKNNPKAKSEVAQAEAHVKELRDALEHAKLN
ncbi:MAG: tetratricopeptide repeat protein [candidate division Zixibacteria bacterium]|jgi:tetratricopeptide (TPR) repeat protein|nr:tetratricopeptide repeat protein [candidate division Zixibacteria bacterium]